MQEKAKGFNIRAFVFFSLALTGLALPVTGIVNHFYAFSPFSAARHAWMSAHNIMGLLFAAFSIWHVALNRRAFLKLIRAVEGRICLRREVFLAGSIMILALFIFCGHALCVG